MVVDGRRTGWAVRGVGGGAGTWRGAVGGAWAGAARIGLAGGANTAGWQDIYGCVVLGWPPMGRGWQESGM